MAHIIAFTDLFQIWKFNKNIELREMKSFALAPPKSA